MDKMNGMFSWWKGDCEDRSMKGKRKKRVIQGKRQKMGSDACLGNDSKEYSMTKKTKQIKIKIKEWSYIAVLLSSGSLPGDRNEHPT